MTQCLLEMNREEEEGLVLSSRVRCVWKEDQGSGGREEGSSMLGPGEKEAELAHFTDPSPSEEVPCFFIIILERGSEVKRMT